MWAGETAQAYDTLTGIMSSFSAVNPTPLPSDFLANLPAAAANVSMSPSGQLALFTIHISPTTTPVPTAEADGEIWTGCGVSVLWLWQNGDLYMLDEIEACVGDYLWSESEETAVIKTIPIPAPCERAQAWVVSIDSQDVTPLFDRKNSPREITALDISPNGQQILWRNEDRELIITDLAGTVINVPDIPQNNSAQWIDNTRILLILLSSEPSTQGLAIYSVPDLALTALFPSEFSEELLELSYGWPVVSPDNKWLAYATGPDRYSFNSVWLVPLPDG